VDSIPPRFDSRGGWQGNANAAQQKKTITKTRKKRKKGKKRKTDVGRRGESLGGWRCAEEKKSGKENGGKEDGEKKGGAVKGWFQDVGGD
jgi:hypothetical protein